MTYEREQRPGGSGRGDGAGARTLSPGKATQVQRVYGAPVQRKPASAGALAEDRTHQLAAEGTRVASGPIPHADTIKASFGAAAPVVDSIQAHVGGPATAATEGMGAEAYATGNHVAFASTPSLHTAAHEATHVVQQRSGVQLKGGVGAAGDPYEQHADAVADRVVAGESAEHLLSAAATSDLGAPAGVVQRKPRSSSTKSEESTESKKPKEPEARPEHVDWRTRRITASDNTSRTYSAPDKLFVGDEYEVTAIFPTDAYDNMVGPAYEGDKEAIKQVGEDYSGREGRIVFQAQRAGAVTIRCHATGEMAHQVVPLHVDLRVVESFEQYNQRLRKVLTDTLASYTAAQKWIDSAALNYSSAYNGFSGALAAASASNDSLSSAVLWGVIKSVTGLELESIAATMAATVVDKGVAEKIGKVYGDVASERVKPSAPESRQPPADTDPLQVLLQAKVSVENNAQALLEIQSRLTVEAGDAQRAGDSKTAEFDVDPSVSLRAIGAIRAELAGQLQGPVPPANVFERGLWVQWLQEYSWKVQEDGTRRQTVRTSEEEFTLEMPQYEAVEDIPSPIRRRIKEIVGSDAASFIAGGETAAEDAAHAQAAKMNREAPATKVSEHKL